MDTSHWQHPQTQPQEIVGKPIEELIQNTFTKQHQLASSQPPLESKTRPQKQQSSNCPRCNSANTKFCYYNNYSLTQPRYFCKTCRRYWTEGGSLRNIPVGGGTRKNNKRSSSPSPSLISPKKMSKTTHEESQQDLNFNQNFRNVSNFGQVPIIENNNKNPLIIPSSSPTRLNTGNTHHVSAMELLNGVSSGSRGFISSFMPMPIHESGMNTVFNSSSGYHHNHMHEYKPSLNFTLDHGYGGLQSGVHELEETSGSANRVLFPFEDLKRVSNTTSNDVVEQINRGDHHVDNSTGYWTGMLGGGGSW